MSDRELMQMALDALDSDCDATKFGASEALRARLAQPEPLPAKSKGALSHEENKQHNKKILDKFYEDNAHLYTTPPQREWQGLTRKQLLQIWGKPENFNDPMRFARAIEAKLKEKNT